MNDSKYTPLVRQARDMCNKVCKQAGVKWGLEETYQLLLENNLINKDGTPTQFAIDKGFIVKGYSFTYSHGLPSIDIDTAIQQVFSRMSKSDFIKMPNKEEYQIKAKPLFASINEELKLPYLTKDARDKLKHALIELKNSLENK